MRRKPRAQPLADLCTAEQIEMVAAIGNPAVLRQKCEREPRIAVLA
jgi:hypothetical protein